MISTKSPRFQQVTFLMGVTNLGDRPQRVRERDGTGVLKLSALGIVFKVVLPLTSFMVFGAIASLAGTGAPDKTTYTLFNRTPETRLRELNTDRPDLTESPYTVDAGWFQVEADFIAYGQDHDKQGGNDIKTKTVSLSAFNFKLGLTPNIDLQTVVSPYIRTRSSDAKSGTATRNSGFGDVLSRLKINFWGNDSGESAFGLMPFVKWPTSSRGLGNDSVEGGLIVPYTRKLPAGWDVGMMTELDIVRNETDDGYTSEWTNSITFGHDLFSGIGGYIELASTLRRGAGHASLDLGCTYAIGKNVQLDLGCSVGLTRATDDLVLFAGWSARF